MGSPTDPPKADSAVAFDPEVAPEMAPVTPQAPASSPASSSSSTPRTPQTPTPSVPPKITMTKALPFGPGLGPKEGSPSTLEPTPQPTTDVTENNSPPALSPSPAVSSQAVPSQAAPSQEVPSQAVPQPSPTLPTAAPEPPMTPANRMIPGYWDDEPNGSPRQPPPAPKKRAEDSYSPEILPSDILKIYQTMHKMGVHVEWEWPPHFPPNPPPDNGYT
jgi:hypothetical protein